MVATEREHSHLHYRDLQMTRSIGDWLAPDRVLPEPEQYSFTVGPRAHERIVLATDGLWDVVDKADAAMLCRRSRTPQMVAERLLKMARHAYKERGHADLRDDTTIVVVDLNPSGRAMTEAPLTCEDFTGINWGCCSCCDRCTLWSCLSPVFDTFGFDVFGSKEHGEHGFDVYGNKEQLRSTTGTCLGTKTSEVAEAEGVVGAEMTER